MSYKRCSPRQKEAVDLLLSGKCCNKPWENRDQALGRLLGIEEQSAKALIRETAKKYRVYHPKWNLGVRLVYLRAKELGLI